MRLVYSNLNRLFHFLLHAKAIFTAKQLKQVPLLSVTLDGVRQGAVMGLFVFMLEPLIHSSLSKPTKTQKSKVMETVS